MGSEIFQREDKTWGKYCPKCNSEQIYKRKCHALEATRVQRACRTCANSDTKNSKRELYHDMRLAWFAKVQFQAALRGILWELTPKDIWDLYIAQDRKCKLSGVDIGWALVGAIHTASLDRIDSAIGYIKGNVQLVHKDVNMMKQAFDQQHFVEVCTAIAEIDRKRRKNG